MAKWNYLSPLLSVSLRLLQNEDVSSWLRHLVPGTEEGAKRGARFSNGAADSPIDQLLGALNLERRPSRASSMGHSLFWAGVGAALAAGALGATKLDKKQLRHWMGEAGERAGGVASRSAHWLEHQALDEWVELLGRVGLEPKPSWPKRAFKAAAWLGAGSLLGVGAMALVGALRKDRHDADKEQAMAEPAPGPTVTEPEATVAKPDRQATSVGHN